MVGRRGILDLVASLAGAALLSGCGFRPVYMPAAAGEGGDVQSELGAVFVGVIGERPGQLLRQALQERFERGGGGAARRYELTVSYGVGGEGIGILQDNSVSRIRLIAIANWTLTRQDTAHTRLTGGMARSIDAYDILNQQYFNADLNSEAAQARLAKAVADQITLQLSSWFRDHAPATAERR